VAGQDSRRRPSPCSRRRIWSAASRARKIRTFPRRGDHRRGAPHLPEQPGGRRRVLLLHGVEPQASADRVAGFRHPLHLPDRPFRGRQGGDGPPWDAAAIIASTRAFIGDKAYCIGPSSIGTWQNPYGRSRAENPRNRRVCLSDRNRRVCLSDRRPAPARPVRRCLAAGVRLDICHGRHCRHRRGRADRAAEPHPPAIRRAGAGVRPRLTIAASTRPSTSSPV